jgi:hypothetical protein
MDAERIASKMLTLFERGKTNGSTTRAEIHRDKSIEMGGSWCGDPEKHCRV